MTTLNRGHWPLGRRRHTIDQARLATCLTTLRTLLDTHRQPGVVSARALADQLGVSDRTVRRWLSEEDLPPAAMLRRVEAWCRRMIE